MAEGSLGQRGKGLPGRRGDPVQGRVAAVQPDNPAVRVAFHAGSQQGAPAVGGHRSVQSIGRLDIEPVRLEPHLHKAHRFGRTADDGVHVHHDLTQEELAQLVGASRETVNKALADFASRGWLRLDGKSIIILDPERLARRARV